MSLQDKIVILLVMTYIFSILNHGISEPITVQLLVAGVFPGLILCQEEQGVMKVQVHPQMRLIWKGQELKGEDRTFQFLIQQHNYLMIRFLLKKRFEVFELPADCFCTLIASNYIKICMDLSVCLSPSSSLLLLLLIVIC